MLFGFLGTYFTGIFLLILSFLLNFVICQVIYAIHSKVKSVQFDYRKKLFFSSCISEIISFASMIIVFIILGAGEYSYILSEAFPVFSVINSSLYIMPVLPVAGIIISAIADFFISYFYGLRNDYNDMEKMQKIIVSIIAAITCAPYIFLISSYDIISRIEMMM